MDNILTREERFVHSFRLSLIHISSTVSGGTGEAERAARAYFERHDARRLKRVEDAAAVTRGRLSRERALELYGKDLRLAASRVERFASCRFSYFMTCLLYTSCCRSPA